ncbi:MAG: DUF1624 domain-containing protein [Lentimicrobiaceae bacterium]|nr:DUF1624 domain-containing protein [Lentimicrobiaceae bacterium]
MVMVLMALDHCRFYFHYGANVYDPVNLNTTTPLLFLTRFITHFCAPVFVFLAGTSAFLYGSKKSKPALSKFLVTRGFWLVFLEIAVMPVVWYFDLTHSFIYLQVIWAIGISMIALAALIHLRWKVLLVIGVLIVAGHNLLDGITAEGKSFTSILWYLLHQEYFLELSEKLMILIGYPVLPWIGVMILGYCLGNLYSRETDASRRKKWLLGLGLGSIALFILLRSINVYGDLEPWSSQKNILYTIFSFINVTKYPPSLDFILLTLGPALLFLYATETIKNRFTNFFIVFGRVPFFYYVLHILFIHLLALLGLVVTGGDWRLMILTEDVFVSHQIDTYGYPMWVVYVIWIAVVLLLYPISRKYMICKARHKDKWWLSYL